MDEKLQNHRVLAFLIIAIAASFYVYDFALRIMPSAMTTELMIHFAIDGSGLGFISSLFFYGYAPMQIPAGLLMDRFGPRLLLTLSVIACSVGAYIFGITHSLMIAGLGRFLIGVGAAFAYIGCLVLASRWYEGKYFALIAGLVQFLGCIGAIIGAEPIVLIVERIGWQQTQIYSAYIGFILAALFWLIIRDRPKHPINIVKHEHGLSKKLTDFQRLRIVISNKQMWAIGLCSFCCWAPISILAELWGISFLSSAHAVSGYYAAQAIALVWIGIAIFSPIFGYWSNRINSRRLPLVVSSIVAIISSILIIYVDNLSWFNLCVSLFFFGVAASAMSVTFGLVQDNMEPDVAGTAVGFNNMTIVAGGMIFQPLVGFFLAENWRGKLINSVPYYHAHNFRCILFIIPLLGLIGLLATLFLIKETHCVAQYDLKVQD